MVFEKAETNMPTRKPRSEVLPSEEPPTPKPREPDKDTPSTGSSRMRRKTAVDVPLSGDERHVTTIDIKAWANSPDLSTAWKGKARLMLHQQSRQRETVLSPKQTKSVVTDRASDIHPTTDDEMSPGRRPSSDRARTSNEWMSNDLYGARKAHKKSDPVEENLERYMSTPYGVVDDVLQQRRDLLVAQNLKSTRRAMEPLRNSMLRPEDKRSSPSHSEEKRVLQARLIELNEKVEAAREQHKKYDANVSRKWIEEKAARDELKAAKNRLAEQLARQAAVENSSCSPPKNDIQSQRANAEHEVWLGMGAVLDRYRELDLKEFGRSNIPPSESRQGYEGTRREHLLKEEHSSSNERIHVGRPLPNPPSSNRHGE